MFSISSSFSFYMEKEKEEDLRSIQESVYRRDALVAKLVCYLLQGLALLAHGAGKLYAVVRLVATLAQQRKGDSLAPILEDWYIFCLWRYKNI